MGAIHGAHPAGVLKHVPIGSRPIGRVRPSAPSKKSLHWMIPLRAFLLLYLIAGLVPAGLPCRLMRRFPRLCLLSRSTSCIYAVVRLALLARYHTSQSAFLPIGDVTHPCATPFGHTVCVPIGSRPIGRARPSAANAENRIWMARRDFRFRRSPFGSSSPVFDSDERQRATWIQLRISPLANP